MKEKRVHFPWGSGQRSSGPSVNSLCSHRSVPASQALLPPNYTPCLFPTSSFQASLGFSHQHLEKQLLDEIWLWGVQGGEERGLEAWVVRVMIGAAWPHPWGSLSLGRLCPPTTERTPENLEKITVFSVICESCANASHSASPFISTVSMARQGFCNSWQCRESAWDAQGRGQCAVGQGPGMHRAEAGLPWGRVLEASPPTVSPLTLNKIIIIFF